MHKGKIFAFVGMAVLGGALYFALQVQAQTSVGIKDSEAVCPPAKTSSNGYTESYINPNTCHSRRVMFGLQGAFRLANCGNNAWCSWKVRCPAGATIKSHSAHYWQMPTMDGYYDGGAGGSEHIYCVDANGYQVDPVPGESETNPYHTHSTAALAKVDVVGSDADYYWSYTNNSWMTCSGGASGPYPEDGEAKANHFHCKNPNFSTANLNDGVYDERDNPEAQPTTGGGPVGDMQAIVGSSGFSTYGTPASTNAMLDIVANQNLWMSPAGTVRCVSANSNSIYLSTDGACPPASQFPAKPTCTLNLSFANGKTSYVKGENVNYTYTCSPAGSRASNATVQVVIPNGTGTANTYNSATNIDTASMGFETTNLVAGTYTLRVCIDPLCASPTLSMSSLQFTVTEPALTTPAPVSGNACSPGGISGCASDNNTQLYCSPTTLKWQFSQYCSTSNRTCFASSGYCKAICGDNICGMYETGADCPGYNDCPLTAITIPAAPTIVTAVYSTENLGQREVVLTVTDNATNETHNQLYWHLSGTAWPNTAPKDTYDISSSTWSEPANVGSIQIFAPTAGGTYEYKLQACNAAGCSSSNIVSVVVPGTTTTTPTTTCTKLGLTTDKASYTKSEIVNYTFSCSTPAGAAASNVYMKLVKPNGTTADLLSITGATSASQSYGLPASDYGVGSYTLKACMDSTCPATSTATVAFAITESATPISTQCTAGQIWCSPAMTGTVTGYCAVSCPTTTPPVIPPSTTSPRACTNGEKCPSGSWCNNGAQCFYPDSQMTCVAWNTSTTDTWTAPMTSVSCPAGTTACNPTDTNCVEKGQTVPYSSGKWCSSGSQQYYSKDGTKMTCAAMNASAPTGYTSCRPDDTNCIPEESYGSSSGWCSRGMKCNQKVTDNNPNNDVYCSKMQMPPNPEPQSCPAGYSMCSSGDTSCKEKGDSWTGTDSSYYCTNAQKCTTAKGGLCVGWNESCPTGTKYCSSTDQNCVEPGETKAITGTNGGGYWCGGGGMTFYSSTKVYCEPMKRGGAVATMMFSAVDIKAILTKLGTGWGLCRPNDNNCIEPGVTGSSTGWCAWMPMGYAMISPTSGSVRSCPPLSDATIVAVPTESATTTPVVILPPVDPTLPRECGPSEIPSPNSNCVTPTYRWNVSTKSFEKCSSSQNMAYATQITTGASAQTMICEPMNLEIEKEWKTEKYMVHPPETEGQWYMPPWDAASPMLQYDPSKDQLVSCDLKSSAAAAAVSYVPPCMPVPEKDKGWMLKKFRAEYRMYKLYAAQNAGVAIPTPVTPGEELKPILPTVPRISGSNQCKSYLFQLRQNLVSDKQFWKDVNRQFKASPKGYPDSADVSKLLSDSKPLLVEVEKLVRGNKCDENSLGTIQDKFDDLHNDFFSEMSIYLPDMQDYIQYGQCKTGLTGYVKRLQSLLKSGTNAESKVAIQELIDSINTKTAELDSHLTDFEYDPAFECADFSNEVSSQIAPLVRTSDKEINRIIEDVVQKKFQPVIDQLTTQLQERGKKVDELLVQVAQLHQAIATMSQSAPMISDRIATSYNSLASIDNKYAKQKTEMEVAKETILPLVSDALTMIKGSKCVTNTDRERLIQEFGTLASVNWVGSSANELEKRVSLFTSSCKSKDVSKSDVDAFIKSVETASVQNLKTSFQQGLTPFADVATHEWYFGPMLTASKEGFMTQGRPGENVLKQDALLMILRATGVKKQYISADGCKLNVPAVMSVSPYAVCAVNYAASHGIALGGSMTTPISRIEMVQWLTKLADLPAGDTSVLADYTDINGLTASQKTTLASIVTSKIMVGNVGDGTAVFNPRNELGRAELAVILGRLLNLNKPVSQ